MIYTKGKSETPQHPHQINAGFTVNEDDVYLNIKVEKEGKEIINQKANSLLWQFIAELAVMFNAGANVYDTTQGYPNNRTVADANNEVQNVFDWAPWVVSTNGLGSPDSTDRPGNSSYTLAAWDGNTINLTHSTSAYLQDTLAGLARICIVGGNYAGHYEVTGKTDISNSETQITVTGLNVTTGDPIDGEILLGFKFRSDSYTVHNSWYNRDNQMKINNIYIGDSTQAVGMNDLWLPGWHKDAVFAHGSGLPGINTPTIVSDNSRIAISQSFQNVSGVAQNVSEFGLATFVRDRETDATEDRHLLRNGGVARGWDGLSLIARDVVSTFQVAAGETITVTYELVTQASGSTGVVAGFNEMLYRQMADDFRVVRNYFNVDWNEEEPDGFGIGLTEYEISSQFYMWPKIGSDQFDYSFFGLQVGTSEDTVDIDDYFLRDAEDNPTRINHGAGDGMLFYYPTRVHRIVTSGSTAYIEFTALFENMGSTDVTIKEVGLTAGWDLLNPVLLSRNILSSGDWVTLSPGQIAKVNYQIGITISN